MLCGQLTGNPPKNELHGALGKYYTWRLYVSDHFSKAQQHSILTLTNAALLQVPPLFTLCNMSSKPADMSSSSASAAYDHNFNFDSLPPDMFTNDDLVGNSFSHTPSAAANAGKSSSRHWNSRVETQFLVPPLETGVPRSGKMEAVLPRDDFKPPGSTGLDRASVYAQMNTKAPMQKPITPEAFAAKVELNRSKLSLSARPNGNHASSSAAAALAPPAAAALAPIFSRSSKAATAALSSANKPTQGGGSKLFKTSSYSAAPNAMTRTISGAKTFNAHQNVPVAASAKLRATAEAMASSVVDMDFTGEEEVTNSIDLLGDDAHASDDEEEEELKRLYGAKAVAAEKTNGRRAAAAADDMDDSDDPDYVEEAEAEEENDDAIVISQEADQDKVMEEVNDLEPVEVLPPRRSIKAATVVPPKSTDVASKSLLIMRVLVV